MVSKHRRTEQKSAKGEKLGNFRQIRKKLLDLKYTKGLAAFGSIKNLPKSTNLKTRKVKLFLEGKTAHTKRNKYRKRFPTSKVIAYVINKIWSPDLAYVDKFAKKNKDVKCLLVAVGCPSRYILVEPLKSKYATTTASRGVQENDKKASDQKSVVRCWYRS